MSNPLNLFPNRIPIGSAGGVPVYMSTEFSRALADVFSRIGGATGMSNDELAVEIASANAMAAVLVLTQTVADLQAELLRAQAAMARWAELKKQVESLELNAVQVPLGPDWERPGKIGAIVPSSGKFTTLNKLTFTQPATGATFTLTDGKTLTVANTLTLSGTDGSTLNIGAGGTLGSAAYAATTAFAARSATALAPAATDPATTQSLANSLRAVLLSVGVGA